MFLGIDLGTSSAKILVIDDAQNVKAEATCPVKGSYVNPPFSEQDPYEWLSAIETALDRIKADQPGLLASVRGIGLSGHMHGAVLLDQADQVLRPCIMWDDGRSSAECDDLEERADFRAIGGNLVMAGFTAPKLLWVERNEPDIFAKIHKVLLPKDFVRLWLTGEYASDMSDASGTLWMDVEKRDWSDSLLSACNLNRSHMPSLCEGTESTGTLRQAHCDRWGFASTTRVAGGAGDNAAAACGMGIVNDGAFVSLGTSGVVFAPTDTFRPYTDRAVHAFCHAVPNTWHQMGVILSAASCLEWVSNVFGRDVPSLLAQLPTKITAPSKVGFLPYLSGVRTPHNDPNAQAKFYGVTSDTALPDLLQGVMEGVGFALLDCFNALRHANTQIEEAYAVGGGARSTAWLEMIASISGTCLLVPEKGDYGAAFGAARLAIAATHPSDIADIFTKPAVQSVIEPNPELKQPYAEAYDVFQKAYQIGKDF